MPAPNFRDLLQQPTDKFERPPALIAGHYRGIIKSHEFGQSAKKKTPYVRFWLVPQAAADETDKDFVDQIAGLTLSEYAVKEDFYITPKSLYRLREFLDATLGAEEGKNFDERIPDTTGVEILFGVAVDLGGAEGKDEFNRVTTVVAA